MDRFSEFIMSEDIEISAACWEYLGGHPVLSILIGIDVVHVHRDINAPLLKLGLVYLGEEWHDKVPPILVMDIPQRGFVRSRTLITLIEQFIRAVDRDTFVEHQDSRRL